VVKLMVYNVLSLYLLDWPVLVVQLGYDMVHYDIFWLLQKKKIGNARNEM
jgi:hypothetical protein